MNRQGKNGIGWTDYTWNPVVGCTKGCAYCYARRQAKRQKHNCQWCYDFVPHLHMERLQDKGLRSKKPRKVFLGSMGELFDPDMELVVRKGRHLVGPSQRVVGCVLRACAAHPQHTFQILTKRPDRAAKFVFPPNVWLGTSIANQADADERIPQLLECKAAVRFVSYEPMHGPVDFTFVIDKPGVRGLDVLGGRKYAYMGKDAGKPTYEEMVGHHTDTIDWLILGAETGNRKGRIVPERWWVNAAINTARDAGVDVFVKLNIVTISPEFAGIQEFPA